MKTDTRERRLRFAPPQPGEEEIVIVPDDFIHFEAINRHGPLPTPFLHAFTPEKNYNALQYRWTKFYNGTKKTDPLFVRHEAQFNAFKARYQDIAHDNSPLAKELLKERGVPIIKRKDHIIHRFFGACASSSLELTATEKGLSYRSRGPILAVRGSQLEITFDDKKTEPDELLALGGNYFAAEWDRNTESIERVDGIPNIIDKKFRRYLDILFYEAFKKQWGIDNLRVLFLTTNVTHKANVMRHLDGMTANALKNRFLFKTRPEFGRRWEMPHEIWKDLLTEPWDSLAGPVHIA